MELTLQPILREQKSVFMQVMELMNYDFSVYSDDDINEYGYYGYEHIDDYWNEDARHPYFIRVDGKIAGLALVAGFHEFAKVQPPNMRCIAEFFVMLKYRRRGIGKEAAMRVFDLHPGNWEVTQWETNKPAQAFWQGVIAAYTKGAYKRFAAASGHNVFTFNNENLQ